MSPDSASRFTPTHLVTVGLAGVLLFVALIGAVAITDPKRPEPPEPSSQSAANGQPVRAIERNLESKIS